jgi:hypothetical protein
MQFFSGFARGELRLNRIEAFTDAVFAIIVTLLVLDLKVPPLHDPKSVKGMAGRLVRRGCGVYGLSVDPVVLYHSATGAFGQAMSFCLSQQRNGIASLRRACGSGQ